MCIVYPKPTCTSTLPNEIINNSCRVKTYTLFIINNILNNIARCTELGGFGEIP